MWKCGKKNNNILKQKMSHNTTFGKHFFDMFRLQPGIRSSHV